MGMRPDQAQAVLTAIAVSGNPAATPASNARAAVASAGMVEPYAELGSSILRLAPDDARYLRGLIRQLVDEARGDFPTANQVLVDLAKVLRAADGAREIFAGGRSR